MANTRPKVKKWKIGRLNEHPEQHALFGDVSDEELAALAANMEKNGQRDPVEILSDGTIISGHQRVRAAKRLGWKEIDVIVRRDLEAAGPAAVQAHLVEDNFLRRQLSPLARARCIKRLMELEEGGCTVRIGGPRREALKARIAKRMGLSSRSVNRYLLLLDAPAAVQMAFDRGALTLVIAGKVALLTKAVQGEIARRIEAGERATQVVSDYLVARGGGDELSRSFARLLAALKREAPQLKGRLNEISPGRLHSALGTIKDADAVLAEMIRRAERASA